MNFTIKPDGPCSYKILCGGSLLAKYWHDSRGDDHGIDFLDGRTARQPVGGMTDFLEGGGPMPVQLTAAAIRYLTTMLPPASGSDA